MKRKTLILMAAWFVIVNLVMLSLSASWLSLSQDITLWPIVMLVVIGMWLAVAAIKQVRKGRHDN